MPAATKPLARVDGIAITHSDLDRTIASIVAAAKAGTPFTVFTLNLDHLVKLRRNDAFRAAYRTADIVTADGAPVVWLARRQNPDITRTTGADLVVPLSEVAARAQVPVYLFGTTAAVLGEAGRELSERTDGTLNIVGSSAPARDFDPESASADAEIDRIAASGARLCYVALGAPKQELFAARARARGVKVGFVCIGAALDFLAGEQVRAPSVMQRYGLEWVWRLALSPSRLAGRYTSCALLFARLALLAPWDSNRADHHPV